MVKVALAQTDGADSPKAPKATLQKKKRRWGLKLFVLSVMLLAGAPSLLSISGQAGSVLSKIHPELGKTVRFRKLNLHWWAPVELSGVQVVDRSTMAPVAEDKTSQPVLADAATVITKEPLWQIVLNGGRGTGLVVREPRVRFIVRDGVSNLDETLTAVFGEQKSNSSSTFPVRLQIENGEVQYLNAVASATAHAEETSETAAKTVTYDYQPIAVASRIAGTFSTMDTQRWMPDVNLTATIRQPGKSDVTSGVNRRTARLAAGIDDIMADFPAVPLEELSGTDANAEPGTTQVRVILNPHADDQGRQLIQFGAKDLDLRVAQPLLTMAGISISASGVVSGGIDARVAGPNFQDGVIARILLAGQDVRIRQADWAPGEWLALGQLDASGAVALAEDGLLVDQLSIQSSVIEVTGSGEIRTKASDKSESGQKVEVHGSVNLARLVTSLRKTLGVHDDLSIDDGRLAFLLKASQQSEAEAAETGGSAASIRPVSASAKTGSEAGKWQMKATLQSLSATRAGQPLQLDPALRLDAVGPLHGNSADLSQARLSGNFGSIDCLPDGGAWKVAGRVSPESLFEQLRQFVAIPATGLRGEMTFQSRVAWDEAAVQLTDVKVNSSDLKASSLALKVIPSNPVTSMVDGNIEVDGTGMAVRTLLAPWHDASWLSERSHVTMGLQASPSREIGLKLHVEPQNVANVDRPGVLSVSTPSSGSVRPVARLNVPGIPGMSASGNGAVRAVPVSSWSLLSPSAFVVDDADLQVALLAKNGGRAFDVREGSLRLPGLTSKLTGTIDVPADQMLVDLSADTSYDLDVLSSRVFASDSGMKFTGQGQDVFRLTGNPAVLGGSVANNDGAASTAFKGSGKIGWQSAVLWGLEVGPAETTVEIDQQILRTGPIRCSLNGGELNVMPQYDIATNRLALGTGSRVQNVQLTPELCRNWLGYVAPMMADSVQVNGTVSARLERFLWNFNHPENSDAQAQLTIHQAQASPGSSLVSLLEVVDLLRKKNEGSTSLAERSLILPEQTIPVQVKQGYVTHEGLTMDLSGYRLRTSGAVGLNEQLQIVMEVPLEKTSAAGAGRSVKVPLRGSISSPQLDAGNLLQNLGTQKLQEQIGDKVDQSLNKQLNKLFDKF
ncbi:MAG: hypothetical protein U0996_10760 [Planctomycetaceae bacterium]